MFYIINYFNFLYAERDGGVNQLGICKTKGYDIDVIKKGNSLHSSAASGSRFQDRADNWNWFPMGAAAFFDGFFGYNS